MENTELDELRKHIADMSSFLQEQVTNITKQDKQLVRRLIEKVTIIRGKIHRGI